MKNTQTNIIQSAQIKEIAREIGFDACGISRVHKVPIYISEYYTSWLKNGQQADMEYLTRNNDLRFDPKGLLPEAETIISVALNYFPRKQLKDSQYQFAWYAYGKDYHDVVKNKLIKLADTIIERFSGKTEIKYRVCCDTAPMLERYWAYQSGLGWIGKNTQLIIPGQGSCFFLGELLISLKADQYDSPQPSKCGSCHRCIDACPGQALDVNRGLSASKCLSYLTIEHKGDFNGIEELKKANTIYGCDVCQKVCPHNRFAKPNHTEEFNPSDEFMNMQPEDWQRLTEDDYRKLFKGSAVKRAKYIGLMRNINKRKL